MDREDFIQSSVRIRYAEKKLLTKQQLQRLADAKSLEDAIKLLNETSYSSEISKLDRPENYEEVLSDVLNKTYISRLLLFFSLYRKFPFFTKIFLQPKLTKSGNKKNQTINKNSCHCNSLIFKKLFYCNIFSLLVN